MLYSPYKETHVHYMELFINREHPSLVYTLRV